MRLLTLQIGPWRQQLATVSLLTSLELSHQHDIGHTCDASALVSYSFQMPEFATPAQDADVLTDKSSAFSQLCAHNGKSWVPVPAAAQHKR